MIELIKNKIINNSRENIIYVHPVMKEDEISKYISAFANTTGGAIVFGVNDDGVSLYIKKYVFPISEEKIKGKMSDCTCFTLSYLELNTLKYPFIIVKSKDNYVLSNGIAYTFDRFGKILELNKKKIFLSYCHSDKCIADIVDAKLNIQLNGIIDISRDERDLKYKDSISRFMRSIDKHDYVITIISQKYLYSKACMSEILELMRDRDYYDKLLFVVLSKDDDKYYNKPDENITADIYTTRRFKYINHWEEQYKKIQVIAESIQNISNKKEIADEAKQIQLISLNIGEFIEKLNDGLGISFKEMVLTDFHDIITVIEK